MRIALVSMPWAIFNRPSIQLGSLKSYLRNQRPELETLTFHPYLEIAEQIGADTYRIISENNWAGEALYSALLFPAQQPRCREVFHTALGARTAARLPHFDQLTTLLDHGLTQWLSRVDFSSVALVGFSVCFSQLTSTLVAARRLKEKYPDLPIVIGGSTCAPAIGFSLLDVFPEIDFIITGEGERPLLQLCDHLADPRTELGSAILRRDCAAPKSAHFQELTDLNDLVVPDYDEYFQELKRLAFNFIPVIPLEFSRGCWWNKCTFCNLNLQWRGYRHKKSEQVVREVATLHKRYQSLDFTFTDNALPVREAQRFFTATASSGSDLRFFAEVRTTLTPETFALYKRGGLVSIQAGIEALSNSLLARMNKGVRVIDNIAAMKFALAAGIELDGNLILEFPGSTPEEVRETLQALDAVLPYRPLKPAAFFLGLGSPIHSQPQKYNIQAITTHPYNRKLFPPALLPRLKLLITSQRGGRTYQKQLWRPVRKKMAQWQEFHAQRPNKKITPLSYRLGGDFLIIRQEQPTGPALHHRLRGLSKEIYLACEGIVTRKELLAAFKSIKKEQLFVFLEDLERKKLLFQDNDACLALALRDTLA